MFIFKVDIGSKLQAIGIINSFLSNKLYFAKYKDLVYIIKPTKVKASNIKRIYQKS